MIDSELPPLAPDNWAIVSVLQYEKERENGVSYYDDERKEIYDERIIVINDRKAREYRALLSEQRKN